MKVFLVGGFLGSGKTTAIQKASTILLERGKNVGVITNDQGDQLVDHRFINSFGIPSLEVINGCFCCRFDQFKERVDTLSETNATEIIFAESVGSCTDLVATVVKPLLQLQRELEVIVSVFVDARVLPTVIRGSRLFADSVNYIYRKQVEEADVLVVNKIDLVEDKSLKELVELVQRHYPDKAVVYQDSLNLQSIGQWLMVLNNRDSKEIKESLELDYDLYGAGEAELAWLDQEIMISSSNRKGIELSEKFINKVYAKLVSQNLPIGHLKFFLNDGFHSQKISFTTINQEATVSLSKVNEVSEISVLINARVQAETEALKKIVADAISEIDQQEDCIIVEKFKSAFQPGYPKPLHRILN